MRKFLLLSSMLIIVLITLFTACDAMMGPSVEEDANNKTENNSNTNSSTNTEGVNITVESSSYSRRTLYVGIYDSSNSNDCGNISEPLSNQTIQLESDGSASFTFSGISDGKRLLCGFIDVNSNADDSSPSPDSEDVTIGKVIDVANGAGSTTIGSGEWYPMTSGGSNNSTNSIDITVNKNNPDTTFLAGSRLIVRVVPAGTTCYNFSETAVATNEYTFTANQSPSWTINVSSGLPSSGTFNICAYIDSENNGLKYSDVPNIDYYSITPVSVDLSSPGSPSVNIETNLVL